MAWNMTIIKKCLVGAVSLCFLTAIYLGTLSMPKTNYPNARNNKHNNQRDIRFVEESQARKLENPISHSHDTLVKSGVQFTSKYHLAVIVPFRERFEELLTFAPYIHKYLNEKGISHDIIVVNQVDAYRFNRAALINAGFLFASSSENSISKPCDYIAMHDVDLLPLNKDLPYDYPGFGSVMHVAAPGLHPKYNYPNFIGGILLVNVNDFQSVDGMSNIYWGWGMEDDEFFVRLKQANIKVNRPQGITTGRLDTFRHIHSPKIRPRDTQKCYNQLNKTRRRDRLTGLHNLNYTFISTSVLTIDQTPVTVLNVRLHCDLQLSPWCDCPNSQTPTLINHKTNGSNPNLKSSTNNNKKSLKKSP